MNFSWPSSRVLAFRAVVSSICILFLPLCLNAQDTRSLDTKLLFTINNLQDPLGYGIFELVDDAAIPLFIGVPIGVTAYGGFAREQDAFQTGLMLTISQLFSLGATVVLKGATGRDRPFEVYPGVKTKHLWSAGGSSFPSGHAAQAFAMATLLSLRHPDALVVASSLVWALTVSTGRIYLGLHFPSDVIGGMVLGAASALIVWQFRGAIDNFSRRTVGPSQHRSEIVSLYDAPIVRLASLQIPFN